MGEEGPRTGSPLLSTHILPFGTRSLSQIKAEAEAMAAEAAQAREAALDAALVCFLFCC